MDELIASDFTAKVVAVVLAVLSALAIRLVNALTSNSTARAVLGRAGEEVRAVVLDVFQTFVGAIKEGRADGKLTADEKERARSMALSKLKANLGKAGLARLARVLGLKNDLLDSWLISKIESGVAEAKLIGTAAGSKTTRPPA